MCPLGTDTIAAMGIGYMFSLLQEDPVLYGMIVMTLLVSITLHELAHGQMAIWLGDDTPRYLGHMTLNPIVHMGPFSIFALLFIGIAWGQMPWDPSRARGKYASALVAAAGPAANLILCLLATVALGLWWQFGGVEMTGRAGNGQQFLRVVAMYNVILFGFNLLPVPPLDGSKILANFNYKYERWAFDPANQGAVTVLFILAFVFGSRLLIGLGTVPLKIAAFIGGV